MNAFKSEHRRLTIRHRVFHFVSHAGRPADYRHQQLGYPAMWYLMVKGRRCPAFPHDPEQSLAELQAALRDWAEDNALGPVEEAVG
jgi:hypothetical protein